MNIKGILQECLFLGFVRPIFKSAETSLKIINDRFLRLVSPVSKLGFWDYSHKNRMIWVFGVILNRSKLAFIFPKSLDISLKTKTVRDPNLGLDNIFS